MSTRRAALTTAAALAALTLAGAGVAFTNDLPQGSEQVTLDPRDFTTRIDNPYWPMRPGTTWVYRETSPDGVVQKVVVRVTDRTKKIANGVVARVVRDTVTEEGKLVGRAATSSLRPPCVLSSACVQTPARSRTPARASV